MDGTSPESIGRVFVEAASALGFSFVPGFSVGLPDGTTVASVGLVREFGSSAGTLVFCLGATPASDQFRAIHDAGYFCSILAGDSYNSYVEHHFVETLNDWGYFGARTSAPSWYTGKSWG
jgi:hypothetical protein